MMTISELRDMCYENAVAKGWWENPDKNVGESFMLMVTELSEAYEEYREGMTVDTIYFKDGKPEGIPVELADVIIRIMDFCGHNGIDIEQVITTKMDYNRTRPHRHGGKLA